MPNLLAKAFFKISTISRRVGKNLTREDRERNALLKEWHRLDAEKQFRTNYQELHSGSVVFDLGGYQGQWASDIFSKYLCEIHIFEPHPSFVKNIRQRFDANDRIKVYPFGLGGKDENIQLVSAADSTSRYIQNGKAVDAELKKMSDFLEKHAFTHIDLLKINIEGGEYELLDHLIASNWVHKIKNIQVQFHHFVPNAARTMLRLQKELEKTHTLTYQFNFFWENWKLKEA